MKKSLLLLLFASLYSCSDENETYLFKVKNETNQVADVTLSSGASSISFIEIDSLEETGYKRLKNSTRELILSVDFEGDSLDFNMDLSKGYGNQEGKYFISFNILDQGQIITTMGYK